jgi:SAM-dependent methyltransferase
LVHATESPDRQRWEERYRSGPRPWDTGITPPEVETFWHSGLLPPAGLALDLGCGSGTNAVWLARQGLAVIGVDLALTALCEAQVRIAADGARGVHLIQADVSRLPFLGLNAAYILDIGCLHGLPLELRPDYAAAIKANLAPGGYYHLYTFDRSPDSPTGENLRGLLPGEPQRLFGPELAILVDLAGKPDRLPSRWLLLHRTSAAQS